MKNKINAYICQGFSPFFIPIKMDLFRKSKFRTALIVKRVSFLDDFSIYATFFKSIIEFFLEKFETKVEFSNNHYIAIKTYNNLLDLMSSVSIKNKAQRTYNPIKFKFIKDRNTNFILSVEDWTDIDQIDVYNSSWVLSFYSNKENINNEIIKYINEFINKNSNTVNIVKRIDEFKQPNLIWFFLNNLWKNKRPRGATIRNSLLSKKQIEVVISKGFNNKVALPVSFSNNKTLFRTGFIIKKQAFVDGIELYLDLIFQVLSIVNKSLATTCFIRTQKKK